LDLKSKIEILFLTFGTLFLAELGDKTQLAVISLSVKTKQPFWVFLGAALALSLISFIGAFLGDLLTRYIPKNIFDKIVGILFILIGFFIVVKN
jgi:putative Ca2+/H+ antiporter (TMEM165/GDT1 family)